MIGRLIIVDDLQLDVFQVGCLGRHRRRHVLELSSTLACRGYNGTTWRSAIDVVMHWVVAYWVHRPVPDLVVVDEETIARIRYRFDWKE